MTRTMRSFKMISFPLHLYYMGKGRKQRTTHKTFVVVFIRKKQLKQEEIAIKYNTSASLISIAYSMMNEYKIRKPIKFDGVFEHISA